MGIAKSEFVTKINSFGTLNAVCPLNTGCTRQAGKRKNVQLH